MRALRYTGLGAVVFTAIIAALDVGNPILADTAAAEPKVVSEEPASIGTGRITSCVSAEGKIIYFLASEASNQPCITAEIGSDGTIRFIAPADASSDK
jgi:hypothetical protein